LQAARPKGAKLEIISFSSANHNFKTNSKQLYQMILKKKFLPQAAQKTRFHKEQTRQHNTCHTM